MRDRRCRPSEHWDEKSQRCLKDKRVIDSTVRKFTRVVPKEELTRGYCVEFARAMGEHLGAGENYSLGGHNVLKYGDIYVDGHGAWTQDEWNAKHGGPPLKDPDGWMYIYNRKKLDEYREILGSL